MRSTANENGELGGSSRATHTIGGGAGADCGTRKTLGFSLTTGGATRGTTEDSKEDTAESPPQKAETQIAAKYYTHLTLQEI